MYDRLFFQLEREGTDEVAVAEEVDGVIAFFGFFERPVARAAIVLSAILDLLHEGVVNLLILKGEEVLVGLAEQVADGVRDTRVEVLQSRFAGDIFRDDEVELEFAYLSFDACFLIAFVEGGEGAGCHLEHGGARDGLRELSVEC